VGHDEFVAALVGLADYARAESLDIGVADLCPITGDAAEQAWAFVQRLPRDAGD
jgi:hypothetical protein